MKLFLFLALSLAASVSVYADGHARLQCEVGTVAYDESRQHVVFSENTTIQLCKEGEVCASFVFDQVDHNGYKTHVESGFCLSASTNLECSYLDSLPEVGDVSNCTASKCATDRCLPFTAVLCNQGVVAYTLDKKLITLRENVTSSACDPGTSCGMYRFNNEYGGHINYVESGVCSDSNYFIHSCDILNANLTGIGDVSNCSFTECTDSLCQSFTIPQPMNRNFRCDAGTFVYSEDGSTFYSTDDVRDAPCPDGATSCTMFRFINTEEGTGTRAYIESGFCSHPYYQNVTCDNLSEQPLVGDVSNCTKEECSGDFCTQFTFLESRPGCPERPAQDDVQLLPGCTVKETLYEVTGCMAAFGEAVYAGNSTQCRAELDQMVVCMTGVVSTCMKKGNDGMFCASSLDAIPGIHEIYEGILQYSQNITSVESLKMLLMSLGATEEQLIGFDLACTDQGHDVLLEMLQGLQQNLSDITIGLGAPVCTDNMILDDLIQWSIEWGISALNATSLGDICLAYDKFKTQIVDAAIHRCYGLERIGDLLVSSIGPYFAGLTQKAVNIAKYFFLRSALPGCEDVPFPTHHVCNVGTVVYLEGDHTAVIRSEADTKVCAPNEECAMFRWVNTDPQGRRSYVESGFCLYEGVRLNCSILLNETNVTSVEQCQFQTCGGDFNTFRCLDFNVDMQPCPEVADDDIAILPQCSVKTSLERGFGCLGPYMGGYPFNYPLTCRNEVDEMVRCLVRSVSYCLAGNCPTILDGIDPHLRATYATIIHYASQAKNLRDALRLIPGITESQIDDIYNLMCHTPGTQLPSTVRDLIDMIPTLHLGSPVCDNRIVDDLISWGINFATTMFEAREHREICVAFATLKSNIMNAWNTRCNADALHGVLGMLLQGEAARFIPIIEKGIRIVTDFLMHLEIPNCANETIAIPDCSQFYDAEGACAMRKAWMCDYVTWKYQFLTTWLKKFVEYSENNMLGDVIEHPACTEMDTTGMCVNEGQLRCATSGDGCMVCFCMDHQYTNVNNILSKWRKDYARWRAVMMKYTELLQSTSTGSCDA